MIAEIVSNGMLSLPSSLAVVGIVPGVVLIVFLGVFATFTSWILIQFKLRHPESEQSCPPSHLVACTV
jgi:amino acid permease